MNVEVVKINGQDAGRKVSLSKDIFGIEPNDHAIYLDVKQHLANRRQGTHKSKERADISGSTRKIKKQKGRSTVFKRRKPEQSELKNLDFSNQYLYDFIRMLADPYPNAFIRIKNKKIVFKSAELKGNKIRFEGEIE